MTTSSQYDYVLGELRRHPRTWLVTGVAGFIGSNLLEQLLRTGQTVVGLDNFSTGHQANIDDVLAGQPEAAHRFRFIEGDIRDLTTCRAGCENVDFVLHQAALGSVPRSVKDPLTTDGVNAGGFLNMLVAARDARVARVVFASSSATYGDSPSLPKEEDHIGRPLSPYAITKYVNELYAAMFDTTYGLPVVGLRYFNVFGRRQDPNGEYAAVIPRWISSLLARVPCRIFGDGETSRDFCYVANAVQANILAATAPSERVRGQVLNVACGERTTLTQLYDKIREGLADYDSEISGIAPIYEGFRVGDIRHSLADITRARTLLGYAPSHSLSSGLADALAWYVASLRPTIDSGHTLATAGARLPEAAAATEVSA